ncbi:12753_t:CDS:2, partial [Entrophospora sp. SA101]
RSLLLITTHRHSSSTYFRYREKDFKLVEYLIYHLFYGKITHFNYNEKKEEFYKAYNLYKKKYEGGKPELISEADKMSLEPFINLLVQIKNNFTKSHVLSIRVINKLKEFGWVDINPLENEDVSSAYKRLKMSSRSCNKILNIIGNNINNIILEPDDPLLSGILDIQHIKENKYSLYSLLKKCTMWDEFIATTLNNYKLSESLKMLIKENYNGTYFDSSLFVTTEEKLEYLKTLGLIGKI